MSDNGRKITIRMPDNGRIGAGFVTKILVEDGGRARGGTPILYIKLDSGKQAIRAPRAGKVYSMVERGQQVHPGDPLFVLLIDESALAKGKRREAKLQMIERERAEDEAGHDVPALFSEDDFVKPLAPKSGGINLGEFVEDWGRLAIVTVILLAAWFGLMPFLKVSSATAPEWAVYGMVGMVGIVAALVFLIFGGNASIWPRRVMGGMAVIWTLVSAGTLFGSADLGGRQVSAVVAEKRDLSAIVVDMFTSDDIEVNKRIVGIKAPEIVMRTSLFVHFSGAEAMPTRELPGAALPETAAPEPVMRHLPELGREGSLDEAAGVEEPRKAEAGDPETPVKVAAERL